MCYYVLYLRGSASKRDLMVPTNKNYLRESASKHDLMVTTNKNYLNCEYGSKGSESVIIYALEIYHYCEYKQVSSSATTIRSMFTPKII
jgi:hypothetical protein